MSAGAALTYTLANGMFGQASAPLQGTQPSTAATNGGKRPPLAGGDAPNAPCETQPAITDLRRPSAGGPSRWSRRLTIGGTLPVAARRCPRRTRLPAERLEVARSPPGQGEREVKRAIKTHLGDFAAIIGLLVLSVVIAGYILNHERLRFPFIQSAPFTINAEFSTAQAVTPGQGQTVRVSGRADRRDRQRHAQERGGGRRAADRSRSTSTSSTPTRLRCCARAPA